MAQPGTMDIWIKGDKNILDRLENVLSTTDNIKDAINELGGFEYYDYSSLEGQYRVSDNELNITLEARWFAPIALLLFLYKRYPELNVMFKGMELDPEVYFTNILEESGCFIEGEAKFDSFEDCLQYLKDGGYIDDSLDEELESMKDLQYARYEWELDYDFPYYSHYVTIEDIYKALKDEEDGDKWGNWFDYVRKTNCTKL